VSEGRYLFAIARGVEAADLVETAGLRGAPLSVVDHRGVQAVVCPVDLAEFGEEPLRRHLEDLAWLEEVARGHDEVVRAVAALATTAPMRLVTICSDDDSVRSRIDALYAPLVAALDRIEGRSEWSVKAYAKRAEVAEEAPAAPAAGGTSGAAYLQRKRERAEARRTSQARGHETAEAIHTALGEHSVAGRRLPAQDARLTGREEPMLLNGAYLVPDDERDAFLAMIGELAVEHGDVELDVRGPWPPYSFAVLDE
jgi:hypothetical protein